MEFKRLIPTILLEDNKMVKTVKYKNSKYIGDPINAVKIFNEKEVDEIILLDISASKNRRCPNYQQLTDIASESFVPITYGGAINSLEVAKKVFRCGVEKISVEKAFLNNNELIVELIKNFGGQSIAASVSISTSFFGKPSIYEYLSGKRLKIPLIKYLKYLEEMGCGEIILNFRDREGTFLGPDYVVVEDCISKVNVPLIIVGGVATYNDISRLFKIGADAVGVGSFFVYTGPHNAVLISYPNNAIRNEKGI